MRAAIAVGTSTLNVAPRPFIPVKYTVPARGCTVRAGRWASSVAVACETGPAHGNGNIASDVTIEPLLPERAASREPGPRPHSRAAFA